MKTAIISGVVWLEKDKIDPINMHFLKNDCTIVPKKTSNYDDRDPIILYFNNKKDPNLIGLPRGYYLNTWKSKTREVYDEVLEISEGIPLRESEVLFTPRPDDQEPVIQQFMQAFSKSWYTGSLEAYTSYGKTCVAIEIIRRLGRNAIVIVHTTALLDQWKDRIKSFLPGWKVGSLQGKNCDYEDCDVTLATVQSLMINPEKYPAQMWSWFGTLCVDEMHRFAAEKFSSVVPKFNSKNTFGVSATLRRLDKTENVFRFILGSVVAKATEENRIHPKIWVRWTDFQSPTDSDQKSTLLSEMESAKYRNYMIAKDIVAAVKKGRNPLVMSERLALLEMVQDFVEAELRKEGIRKTHGFFIGGKKKEERDEAAKCDIVYATVQLAKEGVDISRLDTLFCTTATSDNEQIIGRVVRRHPNKKQPIVVDYVDIHVPLMNGLYGSRLKLYKKNGWQIIESRKE